MPLTGRRSPAGGATTWRERLLRLTPPLLLALLPLAYYWRATIGDVVLIEGDGSSFHLPLRQLVARYWLNGDLPLWNPTLFSGFPLFGDMQTAVLYPTSWLFALLPAVAAMNLQVITTHAIAGLGTYAYTRLIGCNRAAALFSALTFAYGGFLVARIGHLGIHQAAGWLPVLLAGLERLRRGGGVGAVAVGAVALACMVFAGHPQLPAYAAMLAAAYVLFFTVASPPAPHGRLRFALLGGLTVAAGLGLAAVQLLPTAELGAASVRPHLSYDEFISFALPARQLPALLFPFFFGGVPGVPYWGGAQFLGETTAYVGLLAPMLAAGALARVRVDAVTAFWGAVAVGAVLLALGGALPLAHLTFHVPLYNTFRGHDRMLVLFDYAVAVLAGIALSHPWRRAVVLAAVAVVGGMVGIVGLALAAGDAIWGPFASMSAGGEAWRARLGEWLSLGNPALFVPLALAAVAAVALSLYARRPSRAGLFALVALQMADLCLFGWWFPRTFPDARWIRGEPPDVQALASIEPLPFGFRTVLASPGGSGAPGNRAALGAPIVNGFDPLIMSRYRDALGGMTYWGAMPDNVVVGTTPILDWLAVKYLVVTFPNRIPFPRYAAGAPFAHSPLDLRLRPGEVADLPLPAPFSATALALITSFTEATSVADGAPLARLHLRAADGTEQTLSLQAGAHPAGAAAAEILGGAAGEVSSAVVLPVTPAMRVAAVRIEALVPVGTLRVEAATLLDADSGHVHPLSLLHRLLSGDARWVTRQVGPTLAVFENERAFPRAWLVERTRALTQDAVLRATRDGVLPDGSRLDAHREALVEDGARDFGQLDPQARVELVRDEPNRLELRSTSATPAFLVLSEVFYPGWTAAVDGATVPIVRTNYILRGVELPAGDHRVEIVYRPLSVAVGAVLSALTAMALIAAGAWRMRQRAAQER